MAKAKPDALTIAIGGIGSSLHLAGDQFKMMAGVRILNVPYKEPRRRSPMCSAARST